jgi:uncharacterized membrane protein
MDDAWIAAGGVLGVGLLAGVSSAIRVGTLERRVAELERLVQAPDPGASQLAVAARSSVAIEVTAAPPARSSVAIEVAAPPPAPPRPATTGARPNAPPDPAADRWRAFELEAGTRWITWAGACALVIAAALFIKLAVEEGWLGPPTRLGLGAAGAAGLIAAGWRARRAEMRALAHGLFGAGLGVLYVSLYVAFATHELLAPELAFTAMIGVTVGGCMLAIRHDAQAVAVLALLGGLATPVLVSGVATSRDALCAYLVVLQLGALAIAAARRWHALEGVAFAGTWLIFAGWLARHHDRASWGGELAWLAVFHVAFVAVPLGLHLRRRAPVRSSLVAVSGAVALGCAGVIVDWRQPALGVFAVALACGYGVAGALVRRRRSDDRLALALVGLAIAAATVAVPLLLRDRAVTLAWATEALALLAMARAPRDAVVRIAALGALALAAGHAAIARWTTVFPDHGVAALAAVVGAAWAFAAVHHARREHHEPRERWLTPAAALGGAALALVAAHVELQRGLAAADARNAGPALWAAGSLLLVALGGRARAGLVAAAVAATLAGALAAHAYASAAPVLALGWNARFGSTLLALVAIGAVAAGFGRHRDPARARIAWAVAILGLCAAVGSEVYGHYGALDAGRAARRADGALSIAWSALAALLLTAGFVTARRGIRLAGLGLLGVVSAKLVLVDLAEASPLQRVLSFVAIGVVMIGASYAYHRLEQRLRESPISSARQ